MDTPLLNMKVDHIGYAVKSISKAREFLELLGFCVLSEEVIDELQNSKIQFMTNGQTIIELIEPINENSPIVNLLRKVGSTPYHFCFSTHEFDTVFEELKKKAVLIFDQVPAKAFDGKRIAFFYSKEIGLFEILERGGN
ncbi:VOC family protein [Fervidobacterium sp.]